MRSRSSSLAADLPRSQGLADLEADLATVAYIVAGLLALLSVARYVTV